MFRIISSKLRIAWEIHFRAVYISKNKKKRTCFGNLSEYMFPFRGYLFLSWHLTHRGGGRIFAVFWTSDAEKITIFWESSLWEKIAFFRPGQSFCSEQFQKKCFWGESSGIHFLSFFFFVVMFFYCVFWVVFGLSTTSGGLCKKRNFFRVQQMTFFRVRKNGAFWLQRKAAGFVPWLYVKTFDKNPKTIFM